MYILYIKHIYIFAKKVILLTALNLTRCFVQKTAENLSTCFFKCIFFANSKLIDVRNIFNF